MKSKSLLLLFLLVACCQASAEELRLIVSGVALHEGEHDLNEKNYGFGLEYEFNERRNWVPVINLASFKDSNNNNSKYIGAGIKHRFRIGSNLNKVHFDAGVFGLAMTRHDYNNDEPFLGTIPFVSLSNNWVGINVIYVPEIEADMHSFWYFQLSFKLLQI